MCDFIQISNLSEMRPITAAANAPVVFVLDQGDAIVCGCKATDGIFGYRVGDQVANVSAMIRDFRSYEARQGRTPLVFLLPGTSIPPAPRERDAAGWVVHSTDSEAGNRILRSGLLCSRNHLNKLGIRFRAFGRTELGEPHDYADLVNFANPHEPWAEVVVASKQHGRFCSENDRYSPGVRLYFRIQALIDQPNYTRFLGGHAIRDFVELERVEHLAVTLENLGRRPDWTPSAFSREADRLFERLSGDASARASPSRQSRNLAAGSQ